MPIFIAVSKPRIKAGFFVFLATYAYAFTGAAYPATGGYAAGAGGVDSG